MEGRGLAAAVSGAHVRSVHHRQGHHASAALVSNARHSLLSACTPYRQCLLLHLAFDTAGRSHVVQVQTAPRSVHMGRRRSRLATTTLARPATPSASCSASRPAPARALVSALPAARAPPPAAASAAAPARSAAAAGLPTSAVCAAATCALNIPEGGRGGLLVDRIAMYVGWPWLPVPRRIVTAFSTAARLSSASA